MSPMEVLELIEKLTKPVHIKRQTIYPDIADMHSRVRDEQSALRLKEIEGHFDAAKKIAYPDREAEIPITSATLRTDGPITSTVLRTNGPSTVRVTVEPAQGG